MTMTVLATYRDGVLRPAQPLPLREGDTVEITVALPPSPTPDEDEAVRRIRAAKTLDEWVAAANTAPDEENDGYDLLKALDENRKQSGDLRPLFPPELKGITW